MEPLVPAEVDLTGYPFMPLYGHRLFGSDFNATADDTAWRAGVTLWWAAWNQRPAASLPDDDAILARLAGFGRDIKTWRKCRTAALHGFVLCSDGRLYHRALAPLAIDAWDRRVKERERKEKWREKRAGQERSGDGDKTVPGTSENAGRNGREREGQGQGQGEGPIDLKPEEPALARGAPKVSKIKPREAIPEGWTLPAEWRDLADEARLRHALPAVDYAFEAEKFEAWARSNGARFGDLKSGWIKWALDAKPAKNGENMKRSVAPAGGGDKWRMRLKGWAVNRYWLDSWGPRPDEPGPHDYDRDIDAEARRLQDLLAAG